MNSTPSLRSHATSPFLSNLSRFSFTSARVAAAALMPQIFSPTPDPAAAASAAPAHGRRRRCCSRAWSSRPLLPPQRTTASAPLPLHLRRRRRVRPSRALFPSQVDPGGARAAELVHGAVVVGRTVSADTVGSLRLSCRRPSTREVSPCVLASILSRCHECLLLRPLNVLR